MRHDRCRYGIIVTICISAWCSMVSGALDVATSSTTVTRERRYSTWMADSIYSRGQGLGRSREGAPQVSYEHGTFQHALWELFQVTQNQTYVDWIRQGINTVVDADGDIGGDYDLKRYTLDDIRIGESMIKLYQLTNLKRYKIAAQTLRSQISSQPRTPEGGLWHKLRYRQQQWLDGIYMALPFYALFAGVFENSNTTVFNDIGLQCTLIWNHCKDQKTGLLRHGYDYSKQAVWADQVTGASPEVWDRAVGWYIMALVDLLSPPSAIPSSHPTYTLLITQLRSLLPSLVTSAHPQNGGWSLVISQPHERQGNYIETSGTCMFIYSMLKSVRLGFVNDGDGKIVQAATKAYRYVIKQHIVEYRDGTIGMTGTVRVGSLDRNADFDYYTNVRTVVNDLKGTAPFVMASLEYEMLQSRL